MNSIVTMNDIESTDSFPEGIALKRRFYEPQESDLSSEFTTSTDPLSLDSSSSSSDDETSDMSHVDTDSFIDNSLRSTDDQDLRVSINSACSLFKEDSTASSSESETSTTRHSVRFSTISIREYERIAGDHPETTMGVPLGIGWKFYQHGAVAVEDIKQSKRRRRSSNDDSVATATRIDPLSRKKLLKDVFHVPLEDIRMAEADVKKFRKQQEKRKAKDQKRRKELRQQGLDPDLIDEDDEKPKGLCKMLRKLLR